MVNVTDAGAGAAVAAANNINGGRDSVDPDVFAQALRSRMDSGMDVDKMAEGMRKLSNAFPDVAISSYTYGTFESTSTHFINLNDDITMSLSPSLIEAMADDDETFERIRDMIGSLFAAGGSQDLVGVGGANTQRHVVVDEVATRFVEVQRDENGRALSLVSLSLSTEQMVADTLDRMLGGVGNRNGVISLLDVLMGDVEGSKSWGFGGVMTATNSWRIEGMISGAGVSNGMLAGQRTSTQMEQIILQWEIEAEGTMDLFTYMQVMGLCDPLVFDLGDEGINLTSAENGVYFDIKGDGTPVKTGWISGNNAFLYLDKNGNGVVDDVSELFGDFGGFANGFENLAQYDDNGDGVIDENDAIYHQLRLWRDLNGDGVNQADESMTLAEAGIKSINLNYNNDRELDKHGNVIGEQSSFTRTDGSQGLVADAWFRHIK